MAGQMGNKQITAQNLEVVSTDGDAGLVLVKGAVPGSREGWVLVRDAVKRPQPDDVPFPGAIKGGAAADDDAANAAPEGDAAPEEKTEDVKNEE